MMSGGRVYLFRLIEPKTTGRGWTFHKEKLVKLRLPCTVSRRLR